MNKIIELKNISFSYKRCQVYKELSLFIYENRVSFFLGKNGSGKTTLLKMLNGILKPESGDVYIKQKKINTYSPLHLSKVVSYVPQSINSFNDFVVLDYLVLGRYPYIKHRFSLEDYNIARNVAMKMGIEGLLKKTMIELSGGQKQLIAITRALIQDTPIVIMDEPMSALDLGNQAEVLHRINMLKSDGKTVILTTHNPLHAFQIDCIVYIIDNGKLVSQGMPADILNNQNIQLMYGKRVVFDGETNKIIFKLE